MFFHKSSSLLNSPLYQPVDEPTSGLDSFSAIQLCQVLKKVANAGSSVLFTIHQPSSEIFNAFDRLILMNKGRVMFQGLVSEVPSFFAERNHPLPKNYNVSPLFSASVLTHRNAISLSTLSIFSLVNLLFYSFSCSPPIGL
jgi:ABC-type multidrug transport system ATPase subunit